MCATTETDIDEDRPADLIGTRKAADLAGVTPQTIRDWIGAGVLRNWPRRVIGDREWKFVSKLELLRLLTQYGPPPDSLLGEGEAAASGARSAGPAPDRPARTAQAAHKRAMGRFKAKGVKV